MSYPGQPLKRYNDTYGHQAGDIALNKVAQTIKHCYKRQGDFVFRLGGEEFGVVCNVTHTQDAEVLANIAREAIETLQIEHTGNPYKVMTISSGVITLTEDHPMDSNKLYKLADLALYEAKDHGRNRVHVSGSGDNIELF